MTRRRIRLLSLFASLGLVAFASAAAQEGGGVESPAQEAPEPAVAPPSETEALEPAAADPPASAVAEQPAPQAPQAEAPAEPPKPSGGRRIPRLSIPVPENPLVEKYKNQYESEASLEYLSAIMKRSAPYRAFILSEADRLGAPDFLLYLPVIESGFSERAVSKAGAVGIWQFMKNSVSGYSMRIDEWLDERRDPWLSSTAALRKLMENYERLGDWCLALAAYNCGVGAVSSAVRRAGTSDYWELCRLGYFKAETVNYVPKFLAIADILSRSEELGIDWGEEGAETEIAAITVSRAVDINMLAKMTDEDPALFARLNPALHYSITPPSAEYSLKVPAAKKEAVLEILNSGEPLIQYYIYKIRSGDTLYALSRHYGVTIEMIAECNPGIRAESLRIGSNILIPALNEVDAYRGKSDSPQLQFTDTYLVKQGDTLWSIALAYNVQIETLAEKNGMDVDAVLSLGRSLKVPEL